MRRHPIVVTRDKIILRRDKTTLFPAQAAFPAGGRMAAESIEQGLIADRTGFDRNGGGEGEALRSAGGWPTLCPVSEGDTGGPMSAPASRDLAGHLLGRAEVLAPDAYYRLARMVARVLVSRHLRRRRKWCDLARRLAASPGVEDRLVRQAVGWLERRRREEAAP